MLPLLMTDYFQVKLTGLCYGGCVRGVDDCRTGCVLSVLGTLSHRLCSICAGNSVIQGCAYIGSESDV